MMIRLVGPGGAGKSTVGLLLAERLGVPFFDLDTRFSATVGDISTYIDSQGYDAYAARNVRVYADLLVAETDKTSVVALSSGFMTYRDGIHPHYADFRRDIATNAGTYVLLPSVDLETCVAEIVRRQARRPFSRSVEREEQVIRARYAVYRDMPATKIATMRPVAEVVDEVTGILSDEHRTASDTPPSSSRAAVAARRFGKADSESSVGIQTDEL